MIVAMRLIREIILPQNYSAYFILFWLRLFHAALFCAFSWLKNLASQSTFCDLIGCG